MMKHFNNELIIYLKYIYKTCFVVKTLVYLLVATSFGKNFAIVRPSSVVDDNGVDQPAARGPPAALEQVLCGPERVFHKIQCVMNIEA